MSKDLRSETDKRKFSTLKYDGPPALFAATLPQFAIHPATTAVTRIINNQPIFLNLHNSEAFKSLFWGLETSIKSSMLARGYRFLAYEKIREQVKAGIKPCLQGSMRKESIDEIAAGTAGVLEGISERILTNRFDVDKTLQQMGRKAVDLNKGMGAGILRDGASAGCFFLANSFFYHWLQKQIFLSNYVSENNKDNLNKFTAAMLSGTCTAAVTNPLYVLKIRMQMNQQVSTTASLLGTMRKTIRAEDVSAVRNGQLFAEVKSVIKAKRAHGIVASAAEIYAKEGFRGFYKGALGNMAQAPLRALPFVIFLWGKKYWKRYLDKKPKNGQGCVPRPGFMKV